MVTTRPVKGVLFRRICVANRLKIIDDTMIDTLVKMSGITHKVFIEQDSITENRQKWINKYSGTITKTRTNKEIPVISYNDLALIRSISCEPYYSGVYV